MAPFNPVSIAAFILGAGASMGLLVATTNRYESKFEDKAVFLTYAFGLGIGLLLGIGHAWLTWSYWDAENMATSLSVVIVGLIMAVLTALVITVLTNRKAYFNTPAANFVGISAGLGIAGSLIFSKVFSDLNYFYENEMGDPNLYIKLAAYVLAVLFVHAAAGIIQGHETSQGRMRIGLIKSFGVLAPFYSVLFFHYVFFDPFQQWAFPLILSVYGIGFFIFFYKRHFLDALAPAKTKRLRGRRVR